MTNHVKEEAKTSLSKLTDWLMSGLERSMQLRAENWGVLCFPMFEEHPRRASAKVREPL